MVNLATKLTHSPKETQQFAGELAQKILKGKAKKTAFVLALTGELGAGKTTFLQGFARALGSKGKILSPTFILIRKHEVQNAKYKIHNFYHIDCYRITKAKEILDLGFREIISDPQNIVAIEWADRIQKILPRKSLILKFKFIDASKREIKISESKKK